MWLKIANHNQDKPNQRRSQLGTATRLFELSYYLLSTAHCDWSTIFASCFLRVLTSVKKNSDHTKQHCRNKRSMITPEAWTPVIINSQCSSIKWIERSTKYVLPRIKVFLPFSVCFPLFLYVFPCFPIAGFLCFPVFPCFLCFPIFPPIVGFHMTSLKFKLQSYRSYWDFTFMVYQSSWKLIFKQIFASKGLLIL